MQIHITEKFHTVTNFVRANFGVKWTRFAVHPSMKKYLPENLKTNMLTDEARKATRSVFFSWNDFIWTSWVEIKQFWSSWRPVALATLISGLDRAFRMAQRRRSGNCLFSCTPSLIFEVPRYGKLSSAVKKRFLCLWESLYPLYLLLNWIRLNKAAKRWEYTILRRNQAYFGQNEWKWSARVM